MRTLSLLLLFILLTVNCFSQKMPENEMRDQSLFTGNKGIEKMERKIHSQFIPLNLAPTFRLFKTENMWTFIRLNTRTGQMEQLQYDVDGDNRGYAIINIFSLVEKDKEVNGRFTLYPTQNMYTFILLDQIDGTAWQVQWSTDPEKRLVIPF